MAGYREFMAGQVWFYYNMHASKELEKKKELGSCTCRPVVIIQEAFYPEWNDIITVCPITSSDRRSGVFVDSTILKDGSIIEGGTILPYLFFNVKVKFLYPLITSSHKRKILSLSPEDYAKVREGFLYHLGATTKVPDYVENWKHLTDYDRGVVIRDVRVAINEFEEIENDIARANVDNVIKKHTQNPVLVQSAPKGSDHVENHIISTLNHYDRQHKILYEKEDDLSGKSDEARNVDVKLDRHITYTKMSQESFSHLLHETIGGFFPVANVSQVYPGSDILSDCSKDPLTELSIEDQIKITTLTTREVMAQTGIAKEATAYRIRRMLREHDWGTFANYDETAKKMYLAQNDAPVPFAYTGDFALSKSTVRRCAKLRKQFFAMTKSEVLDIMAMPENERKAMPLFRNKMTLVRKFSADANDLYHIDTDGFNKETLNHLPTDSIEKEELSINEDLENHLNRNDLDGQMKIYDLWETLSPQEIREIKSCNRRNVSSIAHNFGITKDKAKSLKRQILEVADPTSTRHQPHYTADPKDVCVHVIQGNPCDSTTIMIFCRTDPNIIASVYSSMKCDNTPSKSEIRKMKLEMRRAIVKDCEWA